MRKLPVVYVERELLKRGCGQSYYTIAYIPSKAYLVTKTESYLENGGVKRSYEVDYIGYDGVNENIEEIGFLVGDGYSAPKMRIYNDYESCKQMTDKLNDELFLRRISALNEDDKLKRAQEYVSVKKLIESLEGRVETLENEAE